MIDYEEGCLITLIFRHRGSVFLRACSFAIPATMLTLALMIMDDLLPDLRHEANLVDLGSSTIWSASGAILVLAIGFRTNRGILRFWEGTGLLHQMRGEWFDTVSNCVSFSIKAGRDPKLKKRVTEFRHTLVRLMSLCHGYALEEISGDEFEIPTINVHGLDRATRRYLKECNETYKFNKVEMTLHLVQSLIVDAHDTGLLDIPAPILSRVFQTISRGFVHLLNTKKITDTKFPFPYSQLIAALLFAATLCYPFVLSSFIMNKVVAAVLTFIPIFAMASLNYIAMEIENPFGQDDNDLPMDHFQKEMDSCLLMLLHPFADTIPSVARNCILDFGDLQKQYGEECKVDLDQDEKGGAEGDPESLARQKKTKLKRWDTKLLKSDSQHSKELEAAQFESEAESSAMDERNNSTAADGKHRDEENPGFDEFLISAEQETCESEHSDRTPHSSDQVAHSHIQQEQASQKPRSQADRDGMRLAAKAGAGLHTLHLGQLTPGRDVDSNGIAGRPWKLPAKPATHPGTRQGEGQSPIAEHVMLETPRGVQFDCPRENSQMPKQDTPRGTSSVSAPRT